MAGLPRTEFTPSSDTESGLSQVVDAIQELLFFLLAFSTLVVLPAVGVVGEAMLTKSNAAMGVHS